MISSNNPNLSRPEVLFQEFAHLDINTRRFSGKKSFDGQVGGFPLLYNKEKHQLAVDATDNHTLVVGASGSKKTRSIVLPAIKVLGYAGESMIINDPKGELYNRTAGELRDLGYNIVTVNLRDPSVGHAWNPLQIPYSYYKAGDMDKAAEFANDIANTLILGEIASDDPFWGYSAYDCCLGLIMLIFKLCKEMDYPDNAVNISNLLQLRRKLFENGVNAKNSTLWKWASKDELIAASLTGSVMTAQDTMRGILATLDQKLRALAIQPSLLEMLANSNFDIEEIGQSKTAVYLITPDEKTTYSSIVAMFISQSYQRLIYSATQSGGRLPIRVNYILDEFSSLPAIGSDCPSMISAARSRNIRYLICIQSKSQLVKRYKEEAATIISNCTNWVIMFTRELELLREVSELCGEKKDRTPNVSVYDLQHLSKEKDEALLLAGKAKPCLVNLLDIDRFGGHSYKVIDFFTPERLSRFNIDFSELPAEAKAIAEEERARLSTPWGSDFNPFNSASSSTPPPTKTEPKAEESASDPKLDVDDAVVDNAVVDNADVDDADVDDADVDDADVNDLDIDELIARIDKRIAELEDEERKEAERKETEQAVAAKLVQVVDTIKNRRDELYQADVTGATEE